MPFPSTESTLREAEGGEEVLVGVTLAALSRRSGSSLTYPPRNRAVFAHGISSRMTDAAPWIGP